MLFPTIEYAIFFLVTLAATWALQPSPPARKRFLLAASYFFYAFWDARFMVLLLGLSVFAWAVAKGIARSRRTAGRSGWLAFGVVGCLAPLAYYKYTSFVLLTAINLASRFGVVLGLRPPTVFLPLGISFMVFHAISLLMDVYRRKLEDPGPLEDTLLYVAFFPQVIAGPILRAHRFLPQLQRAPDASGILVTRALLLIVAGLFKKVVISNYLGTGIVDDVFANPEAASSLRTLLGVYGYAVQIYCDFSGYTDIASGCALLLGYRFPTNFADPYRASSPQDFWHRWHVSLSSWLRDYLFIPLGGSRGGAWSTARNLMITMLLGGLWHGASWTFVLWGAFHGALLVVHRTWTLLPGLKGAGWREGTLWTWASRLVLFQAVCVGWVLFRAPDFHAAWTVLRNLGGRTWAPAGGEGPILAAIAVGIGIQYLGLRRLARLEWRLAAFPPFLRGALASAAILAIEVLGPTGVAPFIYFQF